MKKSKTILLMSAGMLSLTLTACQSNPQQPTETVHQLGQSDKKPRHLQHKKEFDQKTVGKPVREHRMLALQQACVNKDIGETTEIQMGKQSWSGSCELVFAAKRPSPEQRPSKRSIDPAKMHAEAPRSKFSSQQADRILTDARRAELVKQYDQKLAQRQATQQAILNACQGQKVGQSIQLKLGEQQLEGHCQLRFKAAKAEVRGT